jgi:selenide,water dikinase
VRALALWGPLALGPWRWLWRWKERIDRRFMAGFAAGAAGAAMQAGAAMACRGCAAKLAPATLAAALERLTGAAMEAEDAAPLASDAAGSLLLQSVDGFPALLQDPWLNARLTTLHACSDLWACAASVDSAQALVTLPQAEAAIQEELLLQTLAGVRSVLDPLGGRLIGGHSLEGRDGAGLALALVVNGRAPAGTAWAKGPLQPGDALLLSRPIGTGVLFAAAMAGAARPDWLDQALAVMQASQAALVALLAAHGCHACTDITGFGLLGHLGEMVQHGSGRSDPATPVQVELDAEAVPALAGALELLAQGHASTLAPANAQALALLEGSPAAVVWAGERRPDPARQALLLDPQTCGPLLAALPAARAAAAVAALQAAGFPQAALIGQVRKAPGPLRPLRQP